MDDEQLSERAASVHLGRLSKLEDDNSELRQKLDDAIKRIEELERWKKTLEKG